MKKLLCVFLSFVLTSAALAAYQEILPTDGVKTMREKLNANISELYGAIGVGALSGALTGTLPSPAIAAGAISWPNFSVETAAGFENVSQRVASVEAGVMIVGGIASNALQKGDTIPLSYSGMPGGSNQLVVRSGYGNWVSLTRGAAVDMSWYRGTGDGLGNNRSTNKMWDSGNDGAGSGMDSDFFRGHDTAYFLDGANMLSVPAAWTSQPALGALSTAVAAVATRLASSLPYDGTLILTSRVVTIPPGVWAFSYWIDGSNRVSRFPTNGIGHNGGTGDGVGDELYVMKPDGTAFRYYYLDANKVWRTSGSLPGNEDIIASTDLTYYFNSGTGPLTLDWSGAQGYYGDDTPYDLFPISWVWSLSDARWMARAKIELARVLERPAVTNGQWSADVATAVAGFSNRVSQGGDLLMVASNDLPYLTMPPVGVAALSSLGYIARPLSFVARSPVGASVTGSYTAAWSSGQAIPVFMSGNTQAQLARSTDLAAYQTVAGFNFWAQNVMKWVGTAPTSRTVPAGSRGQIRHDITGDNATNVYYHNGSVWGLAFTINTNALPP